MRRTGAAALLAVVLLIEGLATAAAADTTTTTTGITVADTDTTTAVDPTLADTTTTADTTPTSSADSGAAAGTTPTTTSTATTTTTSIPELVDRPAVDAAVPAVGVSRALAAYPFLTGPQFLALFDSMALADTVPASGPAPAITGNASADARIRAIAESRGYRRRPHSTGVLSSIDGVPLHPSAAAALGQLKAAAAGSGIGIAAVSGYRSVDTQRQAFVSRLGASPSAIAAGQADGAVHAVLDWVAAPGYSKHQTGYAVDLVQPGGTVNSFGGSAAGQWMAADNHRNARRFGFVPSYPIDGGLQGPRPEPWEYVYVGTGRSRAHDPFGVVDLVQATAYGRVRVTGWAIDPSEPTAGVTIHAYVGGPVGTPGVLGTNLGPATRPRPDVGRAYTDAGPNHGFDAVASSGRKGGTVPVCVYAINRGAGSTRLLGCRSVALVVGHPVGKLDRVDAGERQLRARGWAIDPDTSAALRVDLTIDGVVVASVVADRPRPDVGAAWPGYGDRHGFDRTVSSKPGWRTLCAYAIDHPGTGGDNRKLGCARRWVIDPDAAFVDLLSSDPFHPAIAALAASGVIGGYDDGTFRPTTAVTRQAIVAMLWRQAGSPAVTGTTGFDDVGAGHPFAEPIAWAAQTGLVSGYTDGTFRPGSTVTRQGLVAMLWRQAGSPPATTPPGFVDVGAGHPFAEPITWAAQTGLVSGYTDDTFRPTRALTRQLAAAILHRAG